MRFIIRDLRFLLIKLLAGRSIIICNAKITRPKYYMGNLIYHEFGFTPGLYSNLEVHAAEVRQESENQLRVQDELGIDSGDCRAIIEPKYII